jgi:Domain of unknown function (DUF6894)
MPRYFFHIAKGDRPIIDDDGVELSDLETARTEAVQAAAEMFRSGDEERLWSGRPWRIWVTDGPGETGQRLFMLQLCASVD